MTKVKLKRDWNPNGTSGPCIHKAGTEYLLHGDYFVPQIDNGVVHRVHKDFVIGNDAFNPIDYIFTGTLTKDTTYHATIPGRITMDMPKTVTYENGFDPNAL